MIIKKFQGKTETEAILAARDEMGNNAVVMNIKKITPKGLSRFFKKELFEITAALEERDSQVTNHEYKDTRGRFGQVCQQRKLYWSSNLSATRRCG